MGQTNSEYGHFLLSAIVTETFRHAAVKTQISGFQEISSHQFN